MNTYNIYKNCMRKMAEYDPSNPTSSDIRFMPGRSGAAALQQYGELLSAGVANPERKVDVVQKDLKAKKQDDEAIAAAEKEKQEKSWKDWWAYSGMPGYEIPGVYDDIVAKGIKEGEA